MNRSDSARSRPRSTRTTAGLRLSYRTRPGTAPKYSNASTWPSRNASCAWVANATWKARPEHDSRITNIHSLISTPAITAWNSPKSTSASAPGACACGTMTCILSRPSSARRRATYRDTVTSATLAPCSATSRCQTRRAVCRCLRGTSRSASSHPSITAAYGPIAGLGRGGYAFRGGGTALASACRTVRRCT